MKPDYDVIVIGAGVVGLSSAYNLSLTSHKSLLLEQVAEFVLQAVRRNVWSFKQSFERSNFKLLFFCNTRLIKEEHWVQNV